MDRRLGRPLPHQLANPTRAHLIAKDFKKRLSFPRRAYSVLAWFSPGCPQLLGRFPRVTHPSATLISTEVPFAFDLHVLSIPPAFNLSQDQTLQFNPLCQLKLTKLFLEVLNIFLYHHTSVKIGVCALSTQAPAQICLIYFFISVTTYIRNFCIRKIIYKLDEFEIYEDLIKDRSRGRNYILT